MSVSPSSPPASSSSGRGLPLSVEALQDRLGGLLLERESLRAAGRRNELERNRRDIGAAQRRLALAFATGHQD
jgi:hypothetical protein